MSEGEEDYRVFGAWEDNPNTVERIFVRNREPSQALMMCDDVVRDPPEIFGVGEAVRRGGGIRDLESTRQNESESEA